MINMEEFETSIGAAKVLEQVTIANTLSEELEISRLELLDALACWGYYIAPMEDEGVNIASLAYQLIIRRESETK